MSGRRSSAGSTRSRAVSARPARTSPAWSDVKGKLAAFDRAALLGLVQDLYATSKANQAFLHTRFGLGGDLLAPYKSIIERWLWPNVLRNQDVSVSAAKKAISDFRKASGQREGLAELMVFYCECAAGFANEYGMDDPGYLDALVRMFEQALKISLTLAGAERDAMLDRLDAVRTIGRDFGYRAGDDLHGLFAKYSRE